MSIPDLKRLDVRRPGFRVKADGGGSWMGIHGWNTSNFEAQSVTFMFRYLPLCLTASLDGNVVKAQNHL